VVDLLVSLADVGLLGELIMSLLLLTLDTGAASDSTLPSGTAKLLPETARFLIGFIFIYCCCVGMIRLEGYLQRVGQC